MNPWRWYRARRGWVQALLGLLVVPPLLVLAYVGGRSLQYASAERDPGVYVPTTANVVVRARDLEGQLPRILESGAWRTFERRILRDPVLRREINGLLQSNQAPTLDDLEDERKPFVRNRDRVLHAIGSDLVGCLKVGPSVETAPFCAIVRLRWLHYLATPFGRFVLPTDSIGGETCLVARQGGQEIRVAFAGSLAIVSNDRKLLEQALLRKGLEKGGERPIEARVVFEGSPGLLKIRRAIQDSGVFPYVKWETARGLTASADLRDAALQVDATFDRAEPLHASAPPLAIRSWAPSSTSGLAVSNTGGADLIAWLRGLIRPGSKDLVGQNIQDALQALDDGGLSAKFLPQLQDGIAVITGVEEQDGRAVPTLALILPSKDAAAAVEALNGLVRKIAGSWGDSKYFTSEPVGETTVYSWSWPRGVKIADLASPTYGALKGTVVIGNNKAFTQAVIRTAEQGDGFDQTSAYRKFRSRLKELGFAAEPSLAGGMIFPPLLRESLDGSLIHVAKLTTVVNGPALRAEIIAELRRSGVQPSEVEIGRAFNEAVDRKMADRESELRRKLTPLDAAKWAAFEASSTPKGVVFRYHLEFR